MYDGLEASDAFPGNDISIAEARKLMSGNYGEQLREALRNTCAPICWYPKAGGEINHSGTVTFWRSPDAVIGITAWHVVEQYLKDEEAEPRRLQIFNGEVKDLADRIISYNARLDLVTFRVDEELLTSVGKTVLAPSTELRVPAEGAGLMIAGFPAQFTKVGDRTANFGLCTILGVTRTVSDKQITWLYEDRLDLINGEQAPDGPINLGGMSGGPLMAPFVSPAGVWTHCLCGIVTEAPKVRDPETMVPKIAAIRADFISSTGRIPEVT